MSQSHPSLTNHTPQNYHTNASFVYSAANTAPVLALLDAQPGESVIDLGCGTGELTAVIKNQVGPSGMVWGVDSSQRMLDKAREATSDHDITYLQADLQTLYSTADRSLQGKFDAVFSSATFHWCKADPGGVIESVRWLLKPGGRIAFEFGGFGNTIGIRAAIHQVLRSRHVDPVPLDPWYFPTVRQYEKLLLEHGMRPGNLELVPRPTPLTTDLFGWLTTFARDTFFIHCEEEDKDKLLREVETICLPDAFWSLASPGIGVKQSGDKPSSDSSESGWEVMYVRLRGTAVVA